MMPINNKASQIWLGQIAGVGDIWLSDEEAKVFNADPDAFAAKRVGLSLSEYAEWVELNGIALCGARTKDGKPCRMQVRCSSDPKDWQAKHRVLLCSVHDPDRSSS